MLYKLHGEIHGRVERGVEAICRKDTAGEPGQQSVEHLSGGGVKWEEVSEHCAGRNQQLENV